MDNRSLKDRIFIAELPLGKRQKPTSVWGAWREGIALPRRVLGAKVCTAAMGVRA